MCKSGKSFISISEAARLLETTETRVLMLLKKKELEGKMEGEAWYVDSASLDLWERPNATDITKTGCGGGCGSCGGH